MGEFAIDFTIMRTRIFSQDVFGDQFFAVGHALAAAQTNSRRNRFLAVAIGCRDGIHHRGAESTEFFRAPDWSPLRPVTPMNAPVGQQQQKLSNGSWVS